MSENPVKRAREDLAINEADVRARMSADWPNLDTAPTQGELRELLLQHDIPHDCARIEWWYLNGHLMAEEGNQYTFFAAFFRLVVPDEEDETKNRHAHAINWALIDHQRKKYLRFSELDYKTPTSIGNLIKRNEYRGDKFVLAALGELSEQNKVPAPDTMMPEDAELAKDRLFVRYNKNIFEQIEGEAPGTYRLHLEGTTNETAGMNPAAEEKVCLDVRVEIEQGPVLHGKDGVVSLGNIEGDMFYYFSPRCSVPSGTVEVNAPNHTASLKVTPSPKNTAWIDHEFGGLIARDADEDKLIQKRMMAKTGGVEGAWDWAALQLYTGEAMSVTNLSDPRKGELLQTFAIVADKVRPETATTPRGQVCSRVETGVTMTAVEGAEWASLTTGIKYPLRWNITVPATGNVSEKKMLLVASIDAQEFITLPAKPSFWEGHVKVLDSEGAQIGEGFIECHGHKDLNDTDVYYQMMHTMMMTPMEGTVPKMDAAVTMPVPPTAYQVFVGPIIESVCAMIAMSGAPPATEAEKKVLQALSAGYLCAYHHGPELKDKIVAFVENAWKEQSPKIKNDFKRMLLRAFMLREMSVVFEKDEEVNGNDANVVVNGDSSLPPNEELAVIPPRDYLTCPASPDDLAVAQDWFTGCYKKDAALSKAQPGVAVGDYLGAQGVNIVIRTMVNNIRPKLTSKFDNLELNTFVETAMSKDNTKTLLNGRSWEWNSSGRGTVTSRACLLNGGRVLFIDSDVPAGKEYKWLVVREEEDQRRFYELVKFTPTGESAYTAECTQVFLPYE